MSCHRAEVFKTGMMERFIILCAIIGAAFGVITNYTTYDERVLTSAEAAQYVANNTAANCTIAVETCNSTERRRIDGTCNNLKKPAAGAARTPYYRLLPADFYRKSASEWEPRLGADNSTLVPMRVARTAIWAEGRVSDPELTSCVAHMAVYYVTDITNTQDTTNYVSWRPNCCNAAGKDEYACAPNSVPSTDYVHRFSGITCLNMTRPLTYQTSGCVSNTTEPLRIVDATPTQDLSPIYGNTIETGRRTYQDGQLTVDEVNNRTFPPTSGIRLLLGVNFVGIIYHWRWHNHFATELQKINPCWTDEQLYNTAREINIAAGQQIFYYELFSLLMGKTNLTNDGVYKTTPPTSYYNSSLSPGISLEYPYILRWMHSFQDGLLNLYYSNGTLAESYPIVNLTANVNYLKQGSNMDRVSQGCFRQPAGNSKDRITDPDIVERGLGVSQRSNDIMTNDGAKGRYYGFQGYIYYLSYCFGDKITSFDQLEKYIDVEVIEILKLLYKNVKDIDLLVGTWAERVMEGAYVTPTVYCIAKEQMVRTRASDRFWFENKDRPYPFTTNQLAQIRNATMARMLCDIGGGVTEIQPKAFLLPSKTNAIVSCDNIPNIDYNAWGDTSCFLQPDTTTT